jgi:hypothetical protein
VIAGVNLGVVLVSNTPQNTKAQKISQIPVMP